MKIFIVFIGLLVLNVSYLSFRGDMERFMREQAFLKFAAEECAAGAAMLLEEDEYGQGKVVFDYEEGREYVDSYLLYAQGKSKLEGTLACQLEFEDDQLGYTDSLHSIPAVTASVIVETSDLFSLPFITVTEIQRKSRYELE